MNLSKREPVVSSQVSGDGLSALHCGADWNNSKNMGWIAIKCSTLRMNPTDFVSRLTF